MAIAGSGGWIPSARVYIYNRELKLQYPFHNVHPSKVWLPESAAAYFIDHPNGPSIYVPTAENGGTYYLAELLVELDLIDDFRPTGEQ